MSHALAATLLAAAIAPFPVLAAEEPVVIIPSRHLAFAEAPAAPGEAQAWSDWAHDLSHELKGSLGAMFAPRLRGPVVKGAPYSAEVVTETSQMLADGNVISRKRSSRVWRDGEGRTRQETIEDGEVKSVFLFDPVANTHHILKPGAKRAVSTPVAPRVYSFTSGDKRIVRVGATEVRVEDGKVTVNGKEVKVRDLDLEVGGKKIRIEDGVVTIDGKTMAAGERRHVEMHTIDGGESPDGTHREEVRVQVIRPGKGDTVAVLAPPAPPMPPTPPARGAAIAPPAPPLPPLPGIQTFRFESTARLGPGVTTSLGAREFDGVRADGKSTTWTIPAGKIGNRNPIHILSETWHSPELQVTVYSRYSDPRTGESVYRLSGIRRGEPDAALFKVPDDYRVKRRATG